MWIIIVVVKNVHSLHIMDKYENTLFYRYLGASYSNVLPKIIDGNLEYETIHKTPQRHMLIDLESSKEALSSIGIRY